MLTLSGLCTSIEQLLQNRHLYSSIHCGNMRGGGGEGGTCVFTQQELHERQ
jgi:hypothetical protein